MNSSRDYSTLKGTRVPEVQFMKRTNTNKLALLIAVFSLGIAFANFPISEAQAHGGRLNAFGCHKDSKRGRHCHRVGEWKEFHDKGKTIKFPEPIYHFPR